MSQNRFFLVNASVLTMDGNCPRTDYIEITGDRISGINKPAGIRFSSTGTTIIDCKGKTVLPGFIDAHQHFISFAKTLIIPNLGKNHVKSIEDIKQVVKKIAATTPPGTWIRAQGYHLYDLEEKRNPTRQDLDEATTDHPVVLTHTTGYINVLNSAGLAKINIDSMTPSPEGGSIERDASTGEPNGILFGMRAYVAKYIPDIGETQISSAVKVISGRLAAMGITSVQDASIQNGLKTWKQYSHYRDTGIMKQRLTMMLGSGAFMKEQYRDIAGEDDRLRVNSVKIVLHEASGELFPPEQELRKIIMKIHRAGMQAAVHAIEEHVIEVAADAVALAIREYPQEDSRHRIEHCLVCPPRLAGKLAETGVVIVTQPNFVYYNGDRYLNTVPDEQMRYMYPIKTLMDTGMVVAAGSDGPVVPQDPVMGIYTAVTRRTELGNRLLPHEGIDLDNAIKMYTLNAAYAAREEKQKGSITPGKLADIVILDRDITRINPEEIKDVSIDTVIIGGEVVFQKG